VRQLLKKVESEMRKLERRRAELTAELDGAGHDHDALARTGTALAELEAELADAEHRWLELAEEAGA
jgi:hypothetical protein